MNHASCMMHGLIKKRKKKCHTKKFKERDDLYLGRLWFVSGDYVHTTQTGGVICPKLLMKHLSLSLVPKWHETQLLNISLSQLLNTNSFNSWERESERGLIFSIDFSLYYVSMNTICKLGLSHVPNYWYDTLTCIWYAYIGHRMQALNIS